MKGLRSYVRTVTPESLKAYYRKSRLALRSVFRSLIRVAHCNVNGIVVKIGVSSETEQFRAETYSTKEPETLEWLKQNLQDRDVFFDVGANIGLYSLYAAKLKPGCTVYSFEPESQNFSRLCRNITLNGVTNIIPCNFPLSGREAFDLLYVSDVQAGSALHSFGRLSDFRAGWERPALAQGAISVTLDALVYKYGAPQPALLKIDVDGIEEEIIDGAEKVLKSETLRTILAELNCKEGVDLTAPEQKLRRLGYRLSRKSDWVAELNGQRSQNYIFRRE